MSKKQNGRNGRKVRLEYHYDRLSNRKLVQVYQALVPVPSPFCLPPIKNAATTDVEVEVGQGDRIEKGGDLNEDNSDLCTGFLNQTKGGKNNR